MTSIYAISAGTRKSEPGQKVKQIYNPAHTMTVEHLSNDIKKKMWLAHDKIKRTK